jgi:hypothetical protein
MKLESGLEAIEVKTIFYKTHSGDFHFGYLLPNGRILEHSDRPLEPNAITTLEQDWKELFRIDKIRKLNKAANILKLKRLFTI